MASKGARKKKEDRAEAKSKTVEDEKDGTASVEASGATKTKMRRARAGRVGTAGREKKNRRVAGKNWAGVQEDSTGKQAKAVRKQRKGEVNRKVRDGRAEAKVTEDVRARAGKEARNRKVEENRISQTSTKTS
ncbi:MAG: hypothetical protein JHC23_00570 [Sulfolobus sp.]|nr:hypothetical protein [Sulfolobus sp.]